MDFHKLCLSPTACIREAMQRMSDTAVQLVLVTPDYKKLAGTVTDGDVRRALLSGYTIDEPLRNIMNQEPKTAPIDWSQEQILRFALSSSIRQIPILDQNQQLTDIFLLENAFQEHNQTSIVVMAGGFGKRLGKLTQSTPKPMIEVGGKPILERIIEAGKSHGFKRFIFSVNYLSQVIQDYFGDGAKHQVNIQYLHEPQPLGTAGSLAGLNSKLSHPCVVMNGDLVTDVHFEHLLSFHKSCDADVTMCVREFELQVPYGVVKLNGTQVEEIQEKPKHQHFVSAGIYVFNPKIFELIPKEISFDIPELLQAALKQRKKIVSFPVQGYWRDLGTPEDLATAEAELNKA